MPASSGSLERDGRGPELAATLHAVGIDFAMIPRTLRIVLENSLAGPDAPDIQIVADWIRGLPGELPFRPVRILMQDTAGIAALVDLAALRDVAIASGQGATAVDSQVRIDLVVDHAVSVETSGQPDSVMRNMAMEHKRNAERFTFFRWAEQAFDTLRVVPPGNGICHQINLEELATGVFFVTGSGRPIADTVIGTDSHTTMVNALGIMGWGVGGMEAESVALGEAIILPRPRVVGCEIRPGRVAGVTATDIALWTTRLLRRHGVVDTFVEFHGAGLAELSLSDRAAIANMAPEYGATCGWFPIDGHTLDYYRRTGRDEGLVAAIARHAQELGTARDDAARLHYDEVLVLDLAGIEPVAAGPNRPDELHSLTDVPASFPAAMPANTGEIPNGAVLIAAITSCTNTSNPHLMIGAGLLARKARRRGMLPPAWVKTSLAPGSRKVADYLGRLGLQDDLDALGFNVVGFGCTTCVGNSGQLLPAVQEAIARHGLAGCAVLSGNRNFDGRIHSDIRSNYLVSPALVVAYALAGTVLKDLSRDAIGVDAGGKSVFLADLWPTDAEVEEGVRLATSAAENSTIGTGADWDDLSVPSGPGFAWDATSATVRRPPFFDNDAESELRDIHDATVLLTLGDRVTTDHISPIGRIAPGSAAARHLLAQGIAPADLGSYGERRGNHEVMWRGTFAHPRILEALPPGETVFDRAEAAAKSGLAGVIMAGKDYGAGSARDWAAKGTALLGVRAVIAESFERIHRQNLIGVGVAPLQLPPGLTAGDIAIADGDRLSILGLDAVDGPGGDAWLIVTDRNGAVRRFTLRCRADTASEVATLRMGGLFARARRRLLAAAGSVEAAG